MDKPKVVVKKKKIKIKKKAKPKPSTQMQTQKVIVNLSDVLKPRAKSKRKASSKASPQVIYQPAPITLQPDIQNIIRSEMARANSHHQQLTPSKIGHLVDNLTSISIPVAPELVTTEPPMMRSIGDNLKPIGERPIILEPVDEDKKKITFQPVGERPIILESPDDDKAKKQMLGFQPVGLAASPDIKMETFEERAKRGRPVGFKVAEESKKKASESMVATKAIMKEEAGGVLKSPGSGRKKTGLTKREQQKLDKALLKEAARQAQTN